MTDENFPSWDQFNGLKAFLAEQFLNQKMVIEGWDEMEHTMIDTAELISSDGTQKFHAFISMRHGGFGFGISNKETCEEIINTALPSENYLQIAADLLKATGLCTIIG